MKGKEFMEPEKDVDHIHRVPESELPKTVQKQCQVAVKSQEDVFGLAKKLLGFSSNICQKNGNELFGQLKS